MQTRKLLIVGMTAALSIAPIRAELASAADEIQGVGTISYCGAAGGLKFKPGLVDGGAAPSTAKFRNFGHFAGCTAARFGTGDGLRIAAIKTLRAALSVGTNDCQSLFVNDGLPPFDLTMTWMLNDHGPKLLPTTINFAATPPSAINLSGPNGSMVITMTGTGASSGSFAGNHFTLEVVTDQSFAEMQEACASGKGFRALTWAPNHHRGNNGLLEDDDD